MSNLGISGDIGPLSFYNTATGKIISYPVAPPKEPPSAAQKVMRQRWRLAMQSWSLLTAGQRETWTRAASSARLKITGVNLWLWWSLYHDEQTIRTIERQSGETLL